MSENGGAVIQAGNLAFMEPDEITGGGEIIDISPETDLVPLVFDASAKSKVLAMVASLKEKYKEVPADLTIKKNYKVVEEAHAVFKKTLTKIEATRKERKAGILEQGRFIDSSAKLVSGLIEEIKEPFTAAKKEFDTRLEIEKREKALAEEKRIDGITDRIDAIKSYVAGHIMKNSSEIAEAIENLKGVMPCTWAEEFTDKAQAAADEALSKITELHTMKLGQEQAAQLAAEAEVKRLADEEAARVAREKQAEEDRKKLAEEQAKLQEERDRLAAEQKKLDDEKAKIAEEKLAEQTRLHNEQKAREAAERADAEKKAKDEEAERGRLEGIRLEGERVQREKDAETEAVAQRLRDEIERLKSPAVVDITNMPIVDPPWPVTAMYEKQGWFAPAAAEAEVKPRFTDEQVRQIDDACMAIESAKVLQDAMSAIPPAEQRKLAGQAMKAIIGNYEATKSLLDAIIQGNIPFIKYTGVV